MKNILSKPAARRLALTGITAAVYVVLSLLFPYIAYGEIQCRLSEVLNLLAFFNPVFAPGIILGCFVTNLFSPFFLDCIIGTGATALTMFFVTRSKSLFTASLWPTVFCVIIGAEILFMSGPPFMLSKFIIITLSVMAGEFLAVTVIGYPLFRFLMKNDRLMQLIKSL